MIRVTIAGCRHYSSYTEAKEFIASCLRDFNTSSIIILSGGCRGADQLGERYAEEHGIPVERHLPDWATYGRAAGPKRNRDMVDAGDMIICFWDGKSRGTASLIRYARKQNKPLFIKMICERTE